MATEEFISQSPRLEARHLIFKDIVFRHSGLVKRDAWRTFCTNTGQHSGDRSSVGHARNKTCRPTPGVPVLDPNSSPRRTLPDSYALTRRRIARQSVVALVPASTTTTPPRFVLECVPETNADTPPRIPPWRPPRFAPPCDVSGTCSAKRPNKSPFGVAQGFVLFGKSAEAGVLSLDERSAWSSKMRNMTCAWGWWFLRLHKTLQLEPRARKICACGTCAMVCVFTFYNSRRLQKNGHIL